LFLQRGMRLAIQLPGKTFGELSTGFSIEKDNEGENAGAIFGDFRHLSDLLSAHFRLITGGTWHR